MKNKYQKTILNNPKFIEYVNNNADANGKNYFSREYLEQEFIDSLHRIQNAYYSEIEEKVPNIRSVSFYFRMNMITFIRDIMDNAIYSRYTSGDVLALRDGIYTCGRLNYLKNFMEQKIESMYYFDPQLDILKASGINDTYLFDRFIDADFYIKPEGYIVGKTIALGIQAVLSRDPEQEQAALKQIEATLHTKKPGTTKRAIMVCLKGIIIHNKEEFEQAIDTLLKYHTLDYFTRGLEKFISLPAHSLYTLAYNRFIQKGLKPPSEPSRKNWDHELWELVKSNHKPEFYFTIQSISPCLARWMEELPQDIHFSELGAEGINPRTELSKQFQINILNNPEFIYYVTNCKSIYGEECFSDKYIFNQFKEKIDNINEINSEERIANDYNIERITNSFCINMTSLSMEILNHAIYTRYVDDDVETLLNGIYTCGRLNYLINLVEQKLQGKLNYTPHYNILKTAVTNDTYLWEQFIKANFERNIDRSAIKKTISRGILALLTKDTYDEEEALMLINFALQNNNHNIATKALLKCIVSIISHDKNFEENLGKLLTCHTSLVYFSRHLDNFISLPAHSLYTFAHHSYIHQGLRSPEEPNIKNWDHELWILAKNTIHREYVIDIASISPRLGQWMDQLPTDIQIEDLLEI